MIMLKMENGMEMGKVRQYLIHARNSMLADKRFATLTLYFDVDPV